MILLVSAVLLIALTVAFTLSVRTQDMVPAEPISPTKHLEDRRAVIYENLRDLQFEYLVGKLSDADYQQTKVGLQKELAGVLAEMERIKTGGAARSAPAEEAVAVVPAVTTTRSDLGATTCPHCGAEFPKPMKFCGECGKAIA
jgi:hypothetical protein